MRGRGSSEPRGREHSTSARPTSVAAVAESLIPQDFRCCCCRVSGNAVTLLTSAFLFALISSVQYFFAVIANSNALKADCVSMFVDALAFLGNLFAECIPSDSAIGKRRIELLMSGISHGLLLGFTIQFILDGWDDAHVDCATDTEDVNGYIVLIFALCGLLFDVISLLSYKYYGFEDVARKDSLNKGGVLTEDFLSGEHGAFVEGREVEKNSGQEDALTCGINTNMCAALLHVLSDLMRSATTLIESLVIIFISDKGGSMCSTKADGISTLAVCSIIVIGATGALLTWLREVFIYLTTAPAAKALGQSSHDDKRLIGSPLHPNEGFA